MTFAGHLLVRNREKKEKSVKIFDCEHIYYCPGCGSILRHGKDYWNLEGHGMSPAVCNFCYEVF